VSQNIIVTAWTIVDLDLYVGFMISRLVLAEIIVTWNVDLGYINIYKGDAAKIFKKLEVKLMIC